MKIKCNCSKCEHKPALTIRKMSSKWSGIQECNYYKARDLALFYSHNYEFNGYYRDNIAVANMMIKNQLDMYSL